ncbi:MAG: FAD-dependent oxidoreductase [Phycisphaera sp.]|nr:FAD-dependent oxidoreductase [Phycisphaera sp.]
MIVRDTHSTSQADSPHTVLVVGGGLAGIAAAVRLARAGVKVTLIETRQRLGGRATSFEDPQTGRTLDNCQHVLLGCCTNLLDLYRMLGVEHCIRWHRTLYFTDHSGAVDTLVADDLPAPLHMTRSLMAFRTLTLKQKLELSLGMLAVMKADFRGRDAQALEEISFLDWLRAHNQGEELIRKFWAVIAISAINELPERMAASHAIQVFQEGFLNHPDAYVMGVSAVPLVQLYDAAQRVIEAAGGRVMLSTGAERFTYHAVRVAGLQTTRSGTIYADDYLSALPFDRLDKLCNEAMARDDARLTPRDRFAVSPIIGIHLWMKNPDGSTVMRHPHLVLMDSPLQWVFQKGHDTEVGGEHLHAVVSAAHGLVDQSAESILSMAEREVRSSVPGAQRATLITGRVVKEKRATFSAAPGSAKLRPGARGAIGNLYLAGDWCQTGWPATMEGAVRSGYLAAHALLEDIGHPPKSLVDDLEPSLLYRMIAR